MKKTLIVSLIAVALWGCSPSSQETQTQQIEAEKKDHPLQYLTIKEKAAAIALPFCEDKKCIDVEIQTLETQDQWLNQWIAQQQSDVIQMQIGLEQKMTLQQAIDAYVKSSDEWRQKNTENTAYDLNLYTKMAYQKNEFTLLQIVVDAKQQDVDFKNRYYFSVADRKQKKTLTLLDVIDAKQQQAMHDLVQQAYQKWLTEQSESVKNQAPKTLYWGQSDWFFDHEGIGLHYRANQIVQDGKQLDIYLTKSQTKAMLKAEIYAKMF